MADIFSDVADALNKLAAAIESAVSQKEEFVDLWGWNTPVLTRDEVAERATDLATRIERIPAEQRGAPHEKWLQGVPAKIDKFIAQTLPNLPGGNAGLVGALMEQLYSYIEGRLPPENWPIEWELAADAGQMPTKLARRLRSLEASLAQLEPRIGSIDEKIVRIEDAHAAAESLPTDLASLAEARARVAANAAELDNVAEHVLNARKSVDEHAATISRQSDEAQKLMANIDDAYRATTSKALADAFAKRSFWLQVQTWVFVALLICALFVGGYIGFRRVSLFEKLLESGRPVNLAMVWINIALSFLSVAAPVWFAWIATKQIAQRFKLAEDYGFKAAVAKAYEGYRREAAIVDPLFVTRLFGSALARLEEAPLRLVDEENYGSPFHELTASPAFREALGVVPALRNTYQSTLEAIGRRVRTGAAEAASPAVAAAVATAASSPAEAAREDD